MKKVILFLVLGLVTMSLVAAPVDVITAQNAAQSFVNNNGSSVRFSMNPSGENLKLLHSEMGNVNAQQPVYYIFTTSDSYVIVSGDDRARSVLAYGNGSIDLNNIPCGLGFVLNMYKEQIDYLLANPGLEVPKNASSMRSADSTGSIAPLLTARWNQGEPYNNQCPRYQGERCYTGCSCTSLSMVIYYWKYSNITDVIPSYTTQTNVATLAELEPTSFDWENMLDTYVEGGYNDVQADAVAKLMRYVGQAEKMDYTPTGSGASGYNIAQAAKMFGYDEQLAYVEKKNYNEDEWCSMMLTELEWGRPIVYVGFDRISGIGHAFNVDGYDAVNDLYHINFGWGGFCDSYYALNAFMGQDHIYNQYQGMVYGIHPPVYGDPVILTDCSSVNFGAGYNGYSEYRSFTVMAENLRQSINISLDGADARDFFIEGSGIITPAQAAQGAEVTIGFYPCHEGTLSATITLSSLGADDVVIPVTGFGIKTGSIIEASDSALSFETAIGNPVSMQLSAVKRDFDGWLASGLEDDSPIQVFSVNASIEGDDSFTVTHTTRETTANGNDSIIFTIQYNPLSIGQHQAQLTLRSVTLYHMAHPVTVTLSGFAFCLGDVDDDGVLTMDDLFILKAAVIDNNEEILGKPNADVNGDGKVDINDLVLLADMIENSTNDDD